MTLSIPPLRSLGRLVLPALALLLVFVLPLLAAAQEGAATTEPAESLLAWAAALPWWAWFVGLYGLIVIVVAATPTTKDDEALARAESAIWRFLERISPLRLGSLKIPGASTTSGDSSSGGSSKAGGAAALLIVLALPSIVGCGGPPRAAQTALSATAEGLAGVDVLVADRVSTAAAAAREAALDIEGLDAALAAYDAAMQPWTTLERVMVDAKASLLALQAAYDAWAAGADGANWYAAVACAIPALVEVGGALTRARVDVPQTLTRAVSLLVPFARGQCPASRAQQLPHAPVWIGDPEPGSPPPLRTARAQRGGLGGLRSLGGASWI